MPGVLTKLSTVTCGHTAPGKPGTVQVQSSAKLRVKDSPVLLAASINGQPVTLCGTPPSSTAIPCLFVKAVSAGAALKLKIGGQPVMLETLKGSTDGTVGGVTPQLSLAAVANQLKLQESVETTGPAAGEPR